VGEEAESEKEGSENQEMGRCVLAIFSFFGRRALFCVLHNICVVQLT